MHELSETISTLANLFNDQKEFYPSAPKDVAEMVLVLKSVLDKHAIKFGTMESEISIAHDKVKQAQWVCEELRATLRKKDALNNELIIRIERFDRILQDKLRRKLKR